MKKLFLLPVLFLLFSEIFAQKADALILYRNKQYPEAIAICEQEITTNPNNIDSYCVLCWSLVRNRQYAEAEIRAAAAEKVSPYDVRIMEIMGEAKYYLGKTIGAMSYFQKYLANVPANGSRIGNAYYYMGEIYILQAKYQHADIAFSSAVHTEPTVALWWTRCGYAREMAGSYDLALTAYNKSLELDPSQYDAARGRERCINRLQ